MVWISILIIFLIVLAAIYIVFILMKNVIKGHYWSIK